MAREFNSSALSLWFLALTAALFVLATEVWQGAPLCHFG
jgi:hypothetical protein